MVRVALLAAAVVAAGLVAIFFGFAGDRDVEVARLVDLLDLGPGESAAEVGAGNGWLTVAVAEHVGPEGQVFSTELSGRRRAQIEEAVADAGLENVTVIAAGEDDSNRRAFFPDARAPSPPLSGSRRLATYSSERMPWKISRSCSGPEHAES